MSVIDDYLKDVDPTQRVELVKLCNLVKQMAPGVEEAISYGMPTFKYKHRPLLGFSAHSTYSSIFPFSPKVVDGVKDELVGYNLSNGTIRFNAEKPVAEDILRKVIEARVKEIDGTR